MQAVTTSGSLLGRPGGNGAMPIHESDLKKVHLLARSL